MSRSERAKTRSQPRRAPALAALACVGVVLALLILEAGLRFSGLAHPVATVTLNDAVTVRRPHAKLRNRTEVIRTLRLNNFGFHDKDWIDSKNKLRVLFLGDSMLEGAQVEQEKTFSQLLENQLSAAGWAIDVMNAGVSGSGTADQYLLWREYLRDRVEIDHLTLILYLGNDLENNHDKLMHAPGSIDAFVNQDGSVRVTQTPSSGGREILRGLSRKSAVAAVAHRAVYRVKRRIANRNRPDRDVLGFDAKAPEELIAHWDESAEGTLNLLRAWAKELEEGGIAFSLALIGAPSRAGMVFQEKMDAEFDGEWPTITLITDEEDRIALRSFDGKTLGHFNEAGHRWVADRLQAWLEGELDSRIRPGRQSVRVIEP